MKRSAVIAFALLGVLCASPAGAQQAGKTYRVGILTAGTTAARRPLVDAFRRAMAGLGYREGTNLEIIYRFAGGDVNRLPALAVDLVRAKPDVIVAANTASVAAAKRATTSIPIVMTATSDPVGSGFIASLARPGGNVTGTTNMNTELEGKRLQLLKELVPHLQRVAVLRNISNFANLDSWRETQNVARTMGIEVIAVDIRSPNQIDATLGAVPHLHAGAILVLNDAVLASNAASIVRLVAAQRIPAVYGLGRYTVAGGLMVYGDSEIADWARSATYVDRILKGAKPADLPVERPTTFELVVNLKTARTLGIIVPQSILLRATDIIQ